MPGGSSSSFMEGFNNVIGGLNSFAGSVGNVVSQVNEFEVPTVKTESSFSVDGKTVGLIGIAVFGLIVLFKRVFR